jgi:hypothetical protein
VLPRPGGCARSISLSFFAKLLKNSSAICLAVASISRAPIRELAADLRLGGVAQNGVVAPPERDIGALGEATRPCPRR